ncbi:MAG: enolase C-terminal domain-like protein [Nanoarchaeota archaeon]
MLIKSIKARKIKDSRGEETIEVSINGCSASSPSGKSKGKYETPSYHKSIEWNIKAINNLKIPFLINNFSDLNKFEYIIKKSFKLKNAKEFGANSLFALESAILKALAREQGKELWQIINPKLRRLKMPIPVGNAIGGGLHSHSKNKPVFQEFLLIPKGRTMKENIKIIRIVYEKLKIILKGKKINDEGAWETDSEEERILSILSKFKGKILIGVDIASSSFYKKNEYKYNDKTLSKEEQIDYINELIQKYNLFYIEDPLQEEDFSGFSKINKSTQHLVVGDDLTVTHIDRIKKAARMKSINALIIKPNQNGSLLEMKEIFEFCKKNRIKTIISHRSGETLDNALADYALGFQADFIKCGIATKWRESKLERLIEIEKSLI